MEEIRDTFYNANAPDIGECIYCGATEGELRTEHAIPYGLNGPWTLHRASCASCEKITTRFEHEAMRRLWPDVRNVLAMQSRRREKRSDTLPLVVYRNGVQETLVVHRDKYPTYLHTPIFPPPGMLWNETPVEGVFANLSSTWLCGPTLRQVSQEHPEYDFIGTRLNFSPSEFARMIAKIGFAASIAILGTRAFISTPIRDVILGKNLCIGHYVGNWWRDPINGVRGGLHELRVMVGHPNFHIHVFIRLFAQFGAPEYHVMLGPANPDFVASDEWPAQWAIANTLG